MKSWNFHHCRPILKSKTPLSLFRYIFIFPYILLEIILYIGVLQFYLLGSKRKTQAIVARCCWQWSKMERWTWDATWDATWEVETVETVETTKSLAIGAYHCSSLRYVCQFNNGCQKKMWIVSRIWVESDSMIDFTYSLLSDPGGMMIPYCWWCFFLFLFCLLMFSFGGFNCFNFSDTSICGPEIWTVHTNFHGSSVSFPYLFDPCWKIHVLRFFPVFESMFWAWNVHHSRNIGIQSVHWCQLPCWFLGRKPTFSDTQ